MVGVPIGTDEYVLERASEVVRDGGADRLARCLANMSDKQAAALIANDSQRQRTSYLERALDTGLSLEECRRADNGTLWAYETLLGLPGAVEAQSRSRRGCRGISELGSLNQAHAYLSAGTGRLELPSTETSRMSFSIRGRVVTLPEAIADLTEPLGDRVKRRELPESNIIAPLGGSLREIRKTWGVTKGAMAGNISEYWSEWGLSAEGHLASTAPETCWPRMTPLPPIPGKPNRSWAS